MNSLFLRHFAPPAPTLRLPSGALTCGGYSTPRRLPSGSYQTCAGIVIGGAIAPALPITTQDGERIQAALLDPRTAAPLPLLVRAARAFWAWC